MCSDHELNINPVTSRDAEVRRLANDEACGHVLPEHRTSRDDLAGAAFCGFFIGRQ
jgi:hypothetical protein